jgi:ribosomal protein S18 acetylase RimI-like enzyme
MTMYDRTALSRVSAYLRARIALQKDHGCLASFHLTLDPASAEPGWNYATPEDGATPTAGDVAALIEVFERRGRTPRLEYIHELAPAVLPRLLEAGFFREEPLALMTCTPESLAADGDLDGIEWLLAEREHELHAAAQVQNAAYGVPATCEADVERLANVVEKGGAVALARQRGGGEALGAGLYSPPLEGVTEIAAIGVREDARGRGIGGAVTALLADHAFVQGVSFPFLMTASGNEHRVYGRAGFRRFGELIGVTR